MREEEQPPGEGKIEPLNLIFNWIMEVIVARLEIENFARTEAGTNSHH